jgi:hypothetical protein
MSLHGPFRMAAAVCLTVSCLACSRSPESGQARAAVARYEGYHDVTNCNGITGWAWDPSRPDEPLRIDIYNGNLLLAPAVTADGFRQDLLNVKKGNGKHGFLLLTPLQLKDGHRHYIYMKYAGTQIELMNGPKEIICRASV